MVLRTAIAQAETLVPALAFSRDGGALASGDVD